MCGIFCSICHEKSEELDKITETVLPLVKNRGPDSCHSHQIKVSSSFANGRETIVTMYASVLHLRGESVTRQPLMNERGDVLLWNGEVFGGIQVPIGENDTEIILKKLSNLPSGYEDACIIDIFSTVQGPWAFVFYESSRKKLWYGRDYFGRRSLISSFVQNTLLLSSVSTRSFKQGCEEITAKRLYCIDLQNLDLNQDNKDLNEIVISFEIVPKFMKTKQNLNTIHRCLFDVPRTFNQCPKQIAHNQNNVLETFSCDVVNRKKFPIQNYIQSSKQTFCNQNEVEDKSICEVVNNKSPDQNNMRPVDGSMLKQIEEEKTSACEVGNGDRLSNQERGQPSETKGFLGNRVENMSICDEVDCLGDRESALSIEQIQEKFVHFLEASIRSRVESIPRSPPSAITQEKDVTSLGILFSGGIDSVVLAAIAHMFVPKHESIDLINVAFEQKYKTPQNVKKKNIKPPPTNVMEKRFDVPDRITGKNAVGELPKNRKWNFIEVNVTLEELQKERESKITNLVSPLQTVLDDSIGCAIWFAARGTGTKFVYNQDNKTLEQAHEHYTSNAKVLLTGMGADEQLGGYARHRTKFEKSGWVGLHDEMKMEVDRISSRNLGRDDRCISDHGREARFPFLDERVVEFLGSLPVCVKCDPRLERGFGEKILLREIALSHLNLPISSCLPKRAIQFGSRIAKLESGKEKGSEKCERLT